MINERKRISIADFHTHILPNVDDGSKSPAESLQMLQALYSQEVRRVVLTPHFYPGRTDPLSFISNREKSVGKLRSVIKEQNIEENSLPHLYVGAEVAYFSGISISRDIEALCITGTKILLLEMPFYRWSRAVIDEVCALSERGIKVVIAHIDRYFQYCSRAELDHMIAAGILVQVNSEGIGNLLRRRRLINMIATDRIQLIGSDCHNMADRPPDMDRAVDLIVSKLGEQPLEKMMSLSSELLNDAVTVF